MAQQRLQKIVAAAGITSRRKAEALVAAGRVAVNGNVVRELGATADPQRDLVTLDGRPLHRERLRYMVAHKPRGVLCAVSDDRGRPLVVDLPGEEVSERLYPAGRLDLDSEGLVLLTNDGDLMQAVTRPGGGAAKVYEVTVAGRPRAAQLAALRAGAEIDGRRLLPCRIEPCGAASEETGLSAWQVTLHEGKKNQIRRMFRSIGHPVKRLVRVAIGPLRLGGLPVGQARELTPAEVGELRAAAAGER